MFLYSPVIIEVPHFASLRGKEREIVILRSDNGETWREHTLEASEEAVQDVLNESFEGEGMIQISFLPPFLFPSDSQVRTNIELKDHLDIYISRTKPARRSPNVSYRKDTHCRFPTLLRGSISHPARGPCGWSRRWHRVVIRCTTSTSCLPASGPY